MSRERRTNVVGAVRLPDTDGARDVSPQGDEIERYYGEAYRERLYRELT